MEDQDETVAANADPLNPAIAKSLYSLCYYLAFGTVYASELAKEFIPPDSMILHGLRDGAEAAQSAWKRSHESDETAESEMDLPDPPASEPQTASTVVEQSAPMEAHVKVSACAEQSTAAEEHVKPATVIDEHEPKKAEESASAKLKKEITELGVEVLMSEIVG